MPTTFRSLLDKMGQTPSKKMGRTRSKELSGNDLADAMANHTIRADGPGSGAGLGASRVSDV